MKIAMVFDGLGVGGIERVGIDYIKIMHDLGYEVDVYNLKPKSNQLEKELVDLCNVNHYDLSHKLCPELYSFGVKKWSWGKFAYPIITSALLPVIQMKKMLMSNKGKTYDIAIAFSGHINDLTFVANDFIKANKKVCWLHGGLAEYLLICSGYGALYSKIKNLCVLSDYGNEMAFNGNKFLLSLNVNKIYNPTYSNERELDEKLIQQLKSEYGDFLLMIGRFTKQKDQATVVRALKILKEEYGIDKKVVFVGDGEDKEAVTKLVKELQLEKDVIFTGARSDVQNYYKAAYMYIHSSPLEGLPTVLLEAMSYDLPIVATRSLPGVVEILQNDKYGLTCEVGNEKDVSEKVYKLISDKALYEFYKKQGEFRANDFKPDHIAKQLNSIFENLL